MLFNHNGLGTISLSNKPLLASEFRLKRRFEVSAQVAPTLITQALSLYHRLSIKREGNRRCAVVLDRWAPSVSVA